ncbi:MAG: hypothetical protein ABIK86_01325 [candidate division WOR-3 bacterium]
MLQNLKLPITVLALSLLSSVMAGPTPVNYVASLRLDQPCQNLFGTLAVTYRNLSDDTLDALWFHIFPNAFSHPGTAYGRELEQQNRFAFSLAPTSARGRLTVTRIETGSVGLAHQIHETELEVNLTTPLTPGDSVVLKLDFTVTLPELSGEIGRRNRNCILAHCLPKIARRGNSGWRVDGYHVHGYPPAEFADYDVSITAPADLNVVATGRPLPCRPEPDADITHRFVARNVPDFALFAGSGLVTFADSVAGTAIQLLSPSRSNWEWPETMDRIADIVRHYSDWYGPYPYEQLTVVQAAGIAAVDASYPGLVILAQRPIPGTRLFEQTLARQMALQWFGPGVDMLESPWLALGPAAHAEMRYLASRYGRTNLVDQPLLLFLFPGLSATYFHRASYYIAASNHTLCRNPLTCRDPLGFAAWNLSRPGLLLHATEQQLGSYRFDSLMQGYLNSTRGRHPTPTDFEHSFPGFSARHATEDPADTLIPSRLNLCRVEVRPIMGLPSFSTYQIFYGPYVWLDNYHGFQLQAWLMGRLFVDAGPLRGRHMWMLSQTYSTRLKSWHSSLSYSTPLEFITNRLRFMVGLDRSKVEAGARANLVYELGPVFRPPQLTAELGYRFLSLYDLRLRDRRAWDSAAFSDMRTRLTHTYELRNFKGRQRLYLARGLHELGGDFSYWKTSIEQIHTFRWHVNSAVTLRVFAGTISGNTPAQEQFYLSGGLIATPEEPVSWGYLGWTSGQERWHYDADANIRGFAGEYLHGRHAWGANLYFASIRLIQPFFDIGNVSDSLAPDLFGQPKLDAGIRLRLGPLYADFPFWRYDLTRPGHQFAFRWTLGLKVQN